MWLESFYLLALTGATYLLHQHWRRKPSPPGPTRYPIVGNILSLPPKLESGHFNALGKTYGSDIIQFEGLGQSVIILNSYDDAKELLDRRSGIYSTRPHSTMLTELSGWGFEFVTWPYNDRWRAARKIFAQRFNSPHIYQPRELTHVHQLLRNLRDEPQEWFEHIKQVPGGVALEMTYGIKVRSKRDPLVQMVKEGGKMNADLISDGVYLVDLLPFLKHLPSWFPGAEFQKVAAKHRAMAKLVLDTPFLASKKSVKQGNYSPSFVTDGLVELGGKEDEDAEHFLKEVAGVVYIAASDTTASTLGTFFLAMTLYPDVQRRVQQELDSVLQGRLPTHSDFPSLPYVNAVALEVFRWQPATPVGGLHATTHEDIYKGLYIPKGSTVIANIKAMLYNEVDFPDPKTFKPERFLKDGKIDPSVRNPMDIAFGFGRRICPGRHIAQSTFILTLASILSVFEISKKFDDTGKVIEPDVTYDAGIVSHPSKFTCAITPRSPQAAKLIDSLELDE